MRKIMELSREFGVECWYLSKWISVKHSLAARDFSENWLTVSVRWVLMLLWITPHCHCGGKGRERAGARPQTASSSCHKCAILGYLLQAPPTIQDKMGSFWHLKAIKAAFNMFFKRCWEKYFALFCTVNFYGKYFQDSFKLLWTWQNGGDFTVGILWL